jgi:hypothetical protein
MRLIPWSIVLFLLLAFGPVTTSAADHAFIGAVKCKMCHNKPEKGGQYDKWLATPHAKAFEVLGSEKAKAIAAEKGIADPQKADACLKCHVTGHGAAAALLTDKYSAAEGVSCESCHGAGGDYWKMNVMKDRALSVAAGMVLPDEKTCTRCHNAESPTFKAFDFATFSAKIAHPDPTTTP